MSIYGNFKIISDIDNTFEQYFRQEKQWTCSLACLRTIMSNFCNPLSEDEIINVYNFKIGPQYSKDIKESKILDNFKVIYGCDVPDKNKTLNYLYNLLKNNFVMIETKINYDHWFVIVNYITNNSNNFEDHELLLYDPYYDETKLYSLKDIFNNWISGEFISNNISKDFIAINKK